jgi:hypothetical protein
MTDPTNRRPEDPDSGSGATPYPPPAGAAQDPYGDQPGERADGSGQTPGQPGAGQPPYGQPPYGQPGSGGPGSAPGGYPAPGYGYGDAYRPPRNGLGVAALVLGILGLLIAWVPVFGILGLLLGVAAVILGFLGRGRAKRGEATNPGAALAGIILGFLAVALAGIITAGLVAFFGSGEGRDYLDCVSRAGGNQAEVQRCAERFGRR